MKMARQIITLIFLLLPELALAQEKDISRLIESIIESHLDVIDEQTDAALMIEDLEGFAENPLNINATTASELSRLYLLNDIQIAKLLEYIKNFGPAFSIYEFQAIDGFSPDLLQKLEPFIRFGTRTEKKKLADAFQYTKNQLLLRNTGTVQKANGYLPNNEGITPYEGNQYRYYSQFRLNADDRIQAGITAEKDPGEAFFSGSNPAGFDYYSAHFAANLNSTFEQIVAGDYLVRAGQGLVIWQGYTSGKSENVLEISKTNQGIRPSTGVDENLFFRGAATTAKFGRMRFSLFYSQKKDDGNLAGNDSTGIYVTSLQTSGYHRTSSEINDENVVKNINYGAAFSLIFNNLKIGATVTRQQLNPPFYPAGELYNRYRFSGNENLNGGIDYQFVHGKYQLFGEAAISKSGGKAVVQGAVIRLNDQFGFSALFRHFDRNYQALWANTFAEGSNMSNESGMYFGVRLLPVKFVTLSAYSDFYRSGWINYSTAAPAIGWDLMVQTNVVLSRNMEFYLRFKNEEKEAKFTLDERYVNLPEQTQKLRFNLNYKPSEFISLKSRAEFASYHGMTKETGFMIFQDLKYNPVKIPVSFSVRVAWFFTDSYNTRIYAYENDLLYTFSIPAFYGKGIRSYLNLQYRVSSKIDFWFKIANTGYTDRDEISSGYNAISGNNRTELKIQLRVKI
jgi:hypothetical protein